MEDIQREELEHKIELLEEENKKLKMRRAEHQQFILGLLKLIQQYIESTSFQDILYKRSPDPPE